VRVLGALAVLDEAGRVDWKILALRADDPQAATLTDIAGAPASVARLAEDIRTWFRLREVPRGGAERQLALGGAWQGREAALAIVEASHARWRALTARARKAAAAEARAIAYGEEAVLARA
jgi:inorganic pyrophosphatase